MIEGEISRKLEELKKLPVKSIYLYGSRVREESDNRSDIDILVVVEDRRTKDKVKRLMRGVDANVVTENELKEYLKLRPSFSIALKESETLYGNPAEEYMTEPNPVAMLAELKEGLKRMHQLRENLDEETDESLTNLVIYSTMLRARQAFIIDSLYNDKPFSNEKFLKELEKRGIDRKYYDYYRLSKEDKLNLILSIQELKNLIDIVENYINEVFENILEDVAEKVEVKP